MENLAIKKSVPFTINDIVDYLPDSIVIRSIVRRTTGNINVVSFDSGEILVGKIIPFDTLIQIIDGRSEIIIDDKSNLVKNGQSIIIPAHTKNTIKANIKFKMLTTIIKSGYEEIIL